MQTRLKQALEQRLNKDVLFDSQGRTIFSLPRTAMEFAGLFAKFNTPEFEREFKRAYGTFHKWTYSNGLPYHRNPTREEGKSNIYFVEGTHNYLLDLLTPIRAETLTGVTYQAMRNWIKEGELTQLTTPGGTYAFSRKELSRVVKERIGRTLNRPEVPMLVLPENTSELIGFSSRGKFVQAVEEATGLPTRKLTPLKTEIGFIPLEAYRLIERWLEGNTSQINPEYLPVKKQEVIEGVERLDEETRLNLTRLLTLKTGFNQTQILDCLDPKENRPVPRIIGDAIKNLKILEYEPRETYKTGQVIKIIISRWGDYTLGVIKKAEERTIRVKREDINREVTMVHRG